MIPTLAQFKEVGASELGGWLIIFIAAAVGFNAVMSAWRKIHPQPPEWQKHLDAARREARENDENIRKDLEAKTDQLHGRVSGLRNEIRADYERASAAAQATAKETGDKVQAAMEKMLTIHTSAMQEIGRINGQLESVVQQGHATQQQLQRHIEKDK